MVAERGAIFSMSRTSHLSLSSSLPSSRTESQCCLDAISHFAMTPPDERLQKIHRDTAAVGTSLALLCQAAPATGELKSNFADFASASSFYRIKRRGGRGCAVWSTVLKAKDARWLRYKTPDLWTPPGSSMTSTLLETQRRPRMFAKQITERKATATVRKIINYLSSLFDNLVGAPGLEPGTR